MKGNTTGLVEAFKQGAEEAGQRPGVHHQRLPLPDGPLQIQRGGGPQERHPAADPYQRGDAGGDRRLHGGGN